MIEFQWKHITFRVKKRPDGAIVYRDAAHLGGPWTLAYLAVENTSIDLSFRRALQKAREEVQMQ